MKAFVYAYSLSTNQLGRKVIEYDINPAIAEGELGKLHKFGDELSMLQFSDDQQYFFEKVKKYIESEKKHAQNKIAAMDYALEKLKEFETALLPCPFCGSKVILNDAVAPFWAVINCTGCRAEMRVNGKTREEARSEATKKWNARVAKL